MYTWGASPLRGNSEKSVGLEREPHEGGGQGSEGVGIGVIWVKGRVGERGT